MKNVTPFEKNPGWSHHELVSWNSKIRKKTATNLFRNMFCTKIYMERDKFLHKRISTIAKISDGIQGVLEIRPWRMQRYAQRPLPPLQQRHQIIHERVIGVSSIRDAFVTPKLPIRLYVIIQDPIVTTLLRFRQQRFVQTLGHFFHSVQHTHGLRGRRSSRDDARAGVHLGPLQSQQFSLGDAIRQLVSLDGRSLLRIQRC